MKKYKIIFTLFGKKHKVSFRASNMEKAVEKLNLFVQSQIKIDDVKAEKEPDSVVSDFMDILMPNRKR